MTRSTLFTLAVLAAAPVTAQHLLVPMDKTQTNHLRAYGLTYWCLQAPRGYECEWLLNFRGGSFLLPDTAEVRARAGAMGVLVSPLDGAGREALNRTIAQGNMERVQLTRAPRVAVYVPPDNEPWDDAVRVALEYAQIEYKTVWDREVLAGKLADYDWLHLHHEDFSGQFGRFYTTFANTPWYRRQVQSSQQVAQALGFPSVCAEKQAVAAAIAGWVGKGGLLFAMCSAPDSLDVALAAQGLDIVPPQIDGTPLDLQANSKLNFARTLAFRSFKLVMDPSVVEISDIDVEAAGGTRSTGQAFELFEFSAKQDPIATMLVQDHVARVPDFMGLTTAFRRGALKDTAIVLGDFPGQDKVKYIHGDYGEGTYTFLGGHDPEDYAHFVGEPATDLSFHPHSPGYRLILNNVLFPAAKTKERKT
ncbi:asparagine synthetase B [bacterium]|nr:asparagine synthetase B [bacterium]